MPLGWDVSPRWAAGLRCRSPRSSVTRCVRPCTSRTPRGAGSLATLGLATRQALHWDTLAFRTTPRRRSVCATRPERADASPARRYPNQEPARRPAPTTPTDPTPASGARLPATRRPDVSLAPAWRQSILRVALPPGRSEGANPQPDEAPALCAVLIGHRPKHRATKVVQSQHGSPCRSLTRRS